MLNLPRIIALTTGVLLLITLLVLTFSAHGSAYISSVSASLPSVPYLTPSEPRPIPSAPANVENFPLLAKGLPLPAVPADPRNATKVHTPLFIGFTRNWSILQQSVVSYLTAGWPADSIYVIDNTGVMDSNALGLLSRNNPFFMNYTRLTKTFGVNVLTTPTLFSFAQLQNYMLYHAIQNQWEHYWWSHMDTVAVSFPTGGSLHARILENLELDNDQRWAVRFFDYDKLALFRVVAFKNVGAWDTHIPFYATDCDMYARIRMAGWTTPSYPRSVGQTFDVGGSIDDLKDFYPPQSPTLIKRLKEMQDGKLDGRNRNFWQGQQMGGQGEPFYRDPNGFSKATRMWINMGREIFREKWGHRDCEIERAGRRPEDAWRVKHDWL
ncbi:hypothetical protein EDC01DRAFT_763022 [Geopyxis carbonaria]|nr:hypothetical protein EDC01DRAFT_763022 [Geopyxis carbonaria]